MDNFAPICNLTLSPTIFCVKEYSPCKTMEDFIQAAKTEKMMYTRSGALGPPCVFMDALSRAAGFQAIHVPYSGTAPAMTAVSHRY